MDTRVSLRGGGGGAVRHRNQFLSPLSPEVVSTRLDEALNGKRAFPAQMTHMSAHGRFTGAVQGPSFHVQSRSALYNPYERRVEGLLLPCAGGTEVRYELRPRPIGTVTTFALVGTLALVSLVGVTLAILLDTLPIVGGAGRLALLVLIAGLWALLVAFMAGARRVARSAERESMGFVAASLDAPDMDILGT